MNIKNMFERGKEYISRSADTVMEKINDKKSAIDEYNVLVSTSNHIQGLIPYEIKNDNPSIGREQMILSSGLTISVDKAKLINSLIPIDETILSSISVVEAKTSMDYIFVITDKRLWILNNKEYKCYDFKTINEFKIVNKSLLSQGVNFDNNAFSFEGNTNDVEEFISIMMDDNVRRETIAKETSYLCGIIPVLQLLNINYAGISVSSDKRIVLHNGKDKNYLINLSDILYMQLLMDNAVVMSRGKDTQAQVSTVMSCRKMSIKFVTNTGEYIIDIMPENVMGTLIRQEDSIYQSSFEFGKNIILTVENMLNGM